MGRRRKEGGARADPACDRARQSSAWVTRPAWFWPSGRLPRNRRCYRTRQPRAGKTASPTRVSGSTKGLRASLFAAERLLQRSDRDVRPAEIGRRPENGEIQEDGLNILKLHEVGFRRRTCDPFDPEGRETCRGIGVRLQERNVFDSAAPVETGKNVHRRRLRPAARHGLLLQ